MVDFPEGKYLISEQPLYVICENESGLIKPSQEDPPYIFTDNKKAAEKLADAVKKFPNANIKKVNLYLHILS